MRGALFCALLATCLLTAHGWDHPSWEWMKRHLEHGRNSVEKTIDRSPTLHKLLTQIKEKINHHTFEKDMEAATRRTRNNLAQNLHRVSTRCGAKVRNIHALDMMVRHMMAERARRNLMISHAVHEATHRVASKMFKPHAPEILPMTVSLSNFVHGLLRKVDENVGKLIKQHRLKLNKEQLKQIVHAAATASLNGQSASQALVDAMKKVPNLQFDEARLKADVEAFRKRTMTEAKADLLALLKAHQMPLSLERAKTMLQEEGKMLLKKLCALEKTHHMKLKMMEGLAAKAFGHMKKDEKEKLMRELHKVMRIAMHEHTKHVAEIFKRHQIKTDWMIVHYMTYDHMPRPPHKHWHHHHGKLRKLILIGCTSFGSVLLIALIAATIYYFVKRSRQARRNPEVIEEKKCGLPYSVMVDEKAPQSVA